MSSYQLLIGQDSGGDVADSNYDLTTLYATQSKDHWWFGFNASTSTTNMVYVLYLDIDHENNSGATSDAQNKNVTTLSTHRPEYAIYVLQNNGTFTDTLAVVYEWDEDDWAFPYTFDSIGGTLHYSPTINYVELGIPNTAIGHSDVTGSYAVSLFSVPNGAGAVPQDTVPSDPNVPGSGQLSRFASITERLNLRMPPNKSGADPTTFASVLPFYWDWPYLGIWSGAIVEVHLDPEFTTLKASTSQSGDPYYAHSDFPWSYDLVGDNTYYWRVRPGYVDDLQHLGAWSQGMSFDRVGFTPQNLQESVTFATPTFSWDMVEGAEYYNIQIASDINFSSNVKQGNPSRNTFTLQETLNNGTYYWRVRVDRWNTNFNEYSPTQSFTLSLPQPIGLTPNASIVNWTPTLCWNPIIMASGGEDVLAAYRYKVQVSQSPTFSSEYDGIEDTEQSCWTPSKGYADGTYYWRVAMRDGDNRLGNYSEVATFTKQYPITTLISPLNGDTVAGTPTFVWTPIDGAAKYVLDVYLDPDFLIKFDTDINTNNTRYTPTKIYPSNQVYYWRVAMVDKNGNKGPYTNAQILIGDANKIYVPLIMK